MESDWPQAVRETVGAMCGTPLTVDRLGGLSSARVYRALGPRHSVIVKQNAREREAYFYGRIAPVAHAAGISTPRLELAYRDDADDRSHWLVLEDIRHAFPRRRWDADAEVLATLVRLHTLSLTWPLDAPDLFVPRWTGEMTSAALSSFSSATAASLAATVHQIEHESQPLFTPHGWIAGDPNPANWGVRDSGELVLFDWDRFAHGAPAIDLAITVPGLGDPVAYERVASRYIAQRRNVAPSDPPLWSPHRLGDDIARAKVWTVVDLLSEQHAPKGKRASAITDWLVSAVPAWMDSIATALA